MDNSNELYMVAEWVGVFVTELEKTIKSYEQHAEFERQYLAKNNCEKDALTIRFPDCNIGPTIYLDDIAARYEGTEPSEAAQLVADNLIESQKNIPEFDSSKIAPEYVKEHIGYRVMNAEANPTFADTSPVHYIADNDLMLVPYVVVSEFDGEQASFRLTNSLQESLKMTDSEVHRYAMANMKSDDFNIRGMNEVMIEMMKKDGMDEEFICEMIPQEEQLYVVSNSSNLFGATAIATPGVLENVNERIGETNFFIIPSSLHEVLIVPESFVSDPADLHDMCSNVNSDPTLIKKEDFLSNNILRYDGEKQELHICNDLGQLKQLTEKVDMSQDFSIKRGM